MSFRQEKDSIGIIDVPAEKYWAAQTQRSIMNFKIGAQQMPKEVIEGFAYLKKAAAHTNTALGVLPEAKRDLISKVCDEILAGQLQDQFPLYSVVLKMHRAWVNQTVEGRRLSFSFLICLQLVSKLPLTTLQVYLSPR